MRAQNDAPGVGRGELDDLERRLEELEKTVKTLEQEGVSMAEEATEAESLLTRLGERFRLSGKAEFQLIDSESNRDAVVGSTENPDPRFAIDVLRLEPRLDFNRNVSMEGQIDFEPEAGDVQLKELSATHQVEPRWWLESEVRLGLDDRFIRPSRPTETYPLVGNVFWRDESLAYLHMIRVGDKDGPPSDAEGEGDDSEPLALPFELARRLGEVRAYFSIGTGHVLDSNEVGFDGAAFNDLVQDDRTVDDRNLSVREIGVGFGYRRSFQRLGELEALAFYYDDELSSDSVDFLQEDLTIRAIDGSAVAGYGDSRSRRSERWGIGGEYFLPAESMYGDLLDVRRNDGLRVLGQWIEATDGDLRRRGWFLQASFRFSFARRLLLDRYFESIEPVVRVGALDTNIPADPLLPGTWDREELLVGAIVEVTDTILIKAEYVFHDERTGAGDGRPGPGSVNNNELLLELYFEF